MIEVELTPVADLQPYSRNAKKHPDSQVARIADSIREFGFNVPVLVDGQGVIVAGYGRFLAARQLGLTEVPTVSLEDLSPEQIRKFRLADNKVAESSWNELLLAEEFIDLKAAGFSLFDIPGFAESEVDKLLKGAQDRTGLTDPDDVPDPRDDHGIRPGDLFRLGDHRLLCGDATSLEDLAILLEGGRCALCFTDPPYNVNYQGGRNNQRVRIRNDHMPADAFYRFMDQAYRVIAGALGDGGAFYICHADAMWKAFREPLANHGLVFRQCLMWVKNRFVLSRGDYHYRHEPILYGHKTGTHFWNGGRDKNSVVYHPVPSIVVEKNDAETLLYINTGEASIILAVPEYTLVYQDEGLESVWQFAKPEKSEEHPTMKPVDLVKRAVRNSSRQGDAVFDPFLGSGTTLIACQELNRACFGMELTPGYCDVIIRRWEAYTGQTAELLKAGAQGLD